MALESLKIRDFDSFKNSKRKQLLVKDPGKVNIKRTYAGGETLLIMLKEEIYVM